MNDTATDGHEFHAWAQYTEFCAKCRDQRAEQQAEEERIHTAAIDGLAVSFAEQATEASHAVYVLRRTVASMISPEVYDIEMAEGTEGADALADLDAALRLLRNVERIAKWRRTLHDQDSAGPRVILANGADTLARALAAADGEDGGLTGLSHQEMADTVIEVLAST